jgi:hypothetical protein
MKIVKSLLITVIVVSGTIAHGISPGSPVQTPGLNQNIPDSKKVEPKHSIAIRSRQANKDLVDLTNYYTSSLEDNWLGKLGGTLSSLPQGPRILAQSAFDVRGIIQLSGKVLVSGTDVVFPKEVKGIVVNNKGTSLHFLQGAVGSVKNDIKIGEYVIHYIDGQTRSVPILYQKNILDWWCKAEDVPPTEAEEAWRGQNPASRTYGYLTHLIKYTWVNPLPDVEISTIDFLTDFVTSVPFLLAITVE